MIELKNNPAGNFFLLAGPCVIEGEEMAMRIARTYRDYHRKNCKSPMYSKGRTAKPTAPAWIPLWASATKRR